MRIFLYEHICALLTTDAPGFEALRPEGEAMLQAVREDFKKLPGVEVLTVPTTDRAIFRATARQADFSLLIAPESDSILAERCSWVEEVGGTLLGPSSGAVRRTGDKWALWEHWQKAGVRTSECRLILPGPEPLTIFRPAVCKPRHGAGSQVTFLVHNHGELTNALMQACQESCGEMILQPFVPGQSASIAWMVGKHERRPLLAAQQTLSEDGRFHYQGGVIPLAPELSERAIRLSDQALAGIDGLQGYVGVDLILGDALDGSRDYTMEINPRLTTSYIGLRKLARFNLAEAMLAAATGQAFGEFSWSPESVTFRADGKVIG